MKGTKQQFLYGAFVVSALACLLLMLSGCTGESTIEVIDPFTDMAPELQRMQGTWVDFNTNDTVECTAIIQGYTIRVRYQGNEEAIQLKQNASIERLDEQRSLIVLKGGTGAWPYELQPENGIEHLELEFFSAEGWHHLDLCRAH